MKIAIVTFNAAGLIVNSVNIKSEDLWLIRQYLLFYGKADVVDFIVRRPKAPEEKSVFDIDLNDYDEIIIYNAAYNLFGGALQEYCYILFHKLLQTYKPAFKYIIVDPKFYYQDFGQFLLGRVQKNSLKYTSELIYGPVTEEKCKQFTKVVSEKTTCIFTGQDYAKFENIIKNYRGYFPIGFDSIMPLFEFGAANQKAEFPIGTLPREFDLVYYGNNRGGSRCKYLNSYFKKDQKLKKLWIGYDPGYLNTTVEEKYIRKELLTPKLITAYATLVLGDIEHNKNIRTARLFEALNSNLVAFFNSDYVDESILADKYLREFCTVSNINELVEKIQMIKEPEMFKKICDLQLKELEAYSKYKMSVEPEDRFSRFAGTALFPDKTLVKSEENIERKTIAKKLF